MPDPFYPTVDIKFLEEQILKCKKINPESKVKVGNTTTFLLAGNKAMHKRIILIRELNPGEVSYEQASGIAIKLFFMGNLMNWLEVNKHWKEGGYVDKVSSGY